MVSTANELGRPGLMLLVKDVVAAVVRFEKYTVVVQ